MPAATTADELPKKEHPQNLKINIICFRNGVEWRRDIDTLNKELTKLGHSVHLIEIPDLSQQPRVDINIFLDQGHQDFFSLATKNYLIPRPEVSRFKPEEIAAFDLILCKTRAAERICNALNPNTLYLGFTCEDRFDQNIQNNFTSPLHLADGSNQKGTDPLVKVWLQNPQFPPLHLLQHGDKNIYPPCSNLQIVTEGLSVQHLKSYQNRHALHICPSEVEGFGDSIVEGLSSGGVVVTTNAPPMNEFVKDARCLVEYNRSESCHLATRYFVDPQKLEAVIDNVLSLPEEELREIGRKNREIYLELDQAFKQRLAAIFNADVFFNGTPFDFSKKNQKTIGIFAYKDARLPPWDPDSFKSGIVGSEEAVIYMSQKLSDLGYKVFVFANPPDNSPYTSESSNPCWVSADFNDGSLFDIAIAWRMPWKAEELKKRADKVYLWPHDVSHGPLTDAQIDGFDDVLWLSEWQRKNWIAENPGFAKFTRIFGNGINPDQFQPVQERKNPHACIYGSNYSRGLEILLDIWPQIKNQFPRATLDIYYGWSHWGLLSAEKEAQLRSKVAMLSSLGVQEHGLVGHEELNRAYGEASLWTYPCILPETFCITALRAQLSGAIPVIIEGSALKETVRHGHRCTNREDYFLTLSSAMQQAQQKTLEERKRMGEFVLKEFTWEAVANKWKQLFDGLPFAVSTPSQDNKTVLLAILARNKAHVLERYLKCINNLEYDKKLITVYIKTDNNEDHTKEMLQAWISKYGSLYESVVFDDRKPSDLQQTNPHEWNAARFKVLAAIRNNSLQKAKEYKCDYYFVVDCDNFIIPSTLRDMVEKNKPIVAPLLRCIPEKDDFYANFFFEATDTGYYKDHPMHYKILARSKKGTFKVDVVHCTYLVDSKYIDKLNYADGTNDYEYIIFCRSARKNNVDQYICNEKEFGVQVHYKDNLTLEEEKNRILPILTMP
jgi:glycosyltransferase involved in cell wall biosynthesis